MSSEASNVIKLLEDRNFGVLSTYSLEVEGYPFGSVTPYGLSDAYCPLIYISDIAQHTKNISNDNRVSLTVLEARPDECQDPQKYGRVTVLGRAIDLTGSGEILSNSLQRYFHRFPESKKYQNVHGFRLFKIDPVRIRYIGGFGQIFWMEPNQLSN